MSEHKHSQGGKVKKIPMRQCLGCNEHKPKGELLRVVRSPEGEQKSSILKKKCFNLP